MVDELLRYVETQLKGGYSPSTLKTNLIRQGYSPALVDGVLESVQSRLRSGSDLQDTPIPGEAQKKSILPLIMIVVTIIGVIGAAVFFVPKLFPKEALLDVKLVHEESSFTAGDEMGFTVEIYNMGSAQKFDVTLTYKIMDDNDNILFSKEETVAVSTSLIHDKKILIPENIKPGGYTMKVFANYNDKIATSAFSFDLIAKNATATTSKASCDDRIKNQDEAGVDCGGVCGGYWYDNSCHTKPKEENPVALESCDDGVTNQDETGIDCGGVCGGYWYDNSCHTKPKEDNPPVINPDATTYTEIIVQVRSTGADNPTEAKELCMKIVSQQGKDSCFNLLAEVANKSMYCDLIEGYEERDACYISFYLQGDFSVCDKLRLADNRENCKQYRDISRISEQINAGNVDEAAKLTLNMTK